MNGSCVRLLSPHSVKIAHNHIHKVWVLHQSEVSETVIDLPFTIYICCPIVGLACYNKSYHRVEFLVCEIVHTVKCAVLIQHLQLCKC